MTLLLYDAFNGLIVGFFYALMALGLSLIIGLNGIINFAQGAFMMLGAYIAFTIMPVTGFWGSLILAPIFAGVLGWIAERALIRPLYGRDALYSLLLTFGLALVIQDLARTIWGAQGLPFHIPSYLDHPISQAAFFVTGYRVVVILVTAIVTGALFAVLRYTRLGVCIRAGLADLEAVSSLGVNVYFLRAANFTLGIALAGVAGILAAGQLGLQPALGMSVIMPSFVAIIVGGVGSLVGSLLGGLLIGVAAGVVTAYYPPASEVTIYVIMALVLAFRPRGLMGEEGALD